MASGIYRLTFSSGKFYIGKSIDIDTRWAQHFNKFALGKAARPMQIEFDRCGLPKTEVIFHCHRDHIDLLEEWLIDQFKCDDMLNTTYPDITRTTEIAELIESNHYTLQLSTWQHLELIRFRGSEIARLESELELAQRKVEEYRTSGITLPQEQRELVRQTNHTARENSRFRNELERLKYLPWYQRLWNYVVYV